LIVDHSGRGILPLPLELLCTCPLDQLLPIAALVFSLESLHSANLFIRNLQCSISVTHQSLSQEIDTVLNMMPLYVHRQFCFVELFAMNGCFVRFPVSFSNPVLYSLVLVAEDFGKITLPKQCD
jgi:hypothetical protein